MIEHTMLPIIREIVPEADIIVDVGAGVRPCLVPCDRRIIIEPHDEYVAVLKENGFDVWEGTALDMLPKAPEEATVLMLDVIEHMTRIEGEAVLRLLERFKRVVLYTPDGFMPQAGEGKDPWGYNGWEWQTHRSGWKMEDFRDYTIRRYGRGLLCYR